MEMQNEHGGDEGADPICVKLGKLKSGGDMELVITNHESPIND